MENENTTLSPAQLPQQVATPAAAPTPTVQQKKKSYLGLIIALVLGTFLLFVAGIGALVFAFFSNKNIPLLSDVAEQVSNLVVSDEQFASSVQEEISSLIFERAKEVSETAVEEKLIEEEQLPSDSFEDYIKSNTEITSYNSKGNTEITVSIPAEGETPAMDFTVVVTADGSYVKKEDAMSLETKLNGEYKAEGTSFEFDGDFKVINDEVFLKLNTIPALGFDLSELKDKWFFIDISENEDLATSIIEAQETSVDLEEQITDKDIENINKLITGKTINDSITRLPEETHDGVRTNCFALDMKGEDFVSLIQEAEVLWDVAEEEKLTSENETEINDAIKSFNIEVCSGKQDKLIYRMDISGEFEIEGVTVTLTSNSTMSDYNSSDISISKPEGAEDFMEVVGTLFAPETPVDTTTLTYEEFSALYGDGYTEEELQGYYQDYLAYLEQ